MSADAPRLPGIRLIVLVGLCAVLFVGLAIGASLLALQHDAHVRHQSEDALALTHITFDAESLASRLRTVQELGEQSGARASMAAAQLHEVLRAIDIDTGEWARRADDAGSRALPAEAQGQLAALRSALLALRATIVLPGAAAPAGGGAAAGSASGAPVDTPVGPAIMAATERAYLATVEAAQASLLAAVRAGTDPPVLRNFTLTQLFSAAVIGASATALVLGLLLALLIRHARRESRVAIGVMGQLLRTDALTGITNRRGLDESLPVEMARARRSGKTLAVAMLDLDYFKRYNSRRGHAGGDSLLRSAAQSWRRQLRPTDMLVRYGGEEFTLVLPSCDADQACQLIERLRPQLPDAQTFSAGVATWDSHESPENLLRRADQALMLAKKQGRNRTIVAGREEQIPLALSV